MKELSLEEKAKAYDEALKVLHKYDGAHIMFTQDLKEEMFPELKESEDERIRKAIIEFFELQDDNTTYSFIPKKDILAWLEKQGEPADKGEISDGYHTFNELYYYRMLYNAAFFNLLPKNLVHKSKKHHDGEECFGGGWFIVMANLPTGQISNHYELKYWDLFTIPEKEFADKWDGHTPQEAAERLRMYLLEKQDEQNPIDKVESKFNVGDWVVNTITNNVEQIIEVTSNEYICSGNLIVSFDEQHLFRKWTIQDAKDGDVLADGNLPFILKKIDTNKYSYAYCGISVDDGFKIESDGESGEWTWMQDIKPATKEQRDLLFKKMKEAGYSFDFETKELKKDEIKIKAGRNYRCTKTHKYAGLDWFEGTKYYADEDYSLVNNGCTCFCPKYSKYEHNNLFEEVKYDGCVEKQGGQKPDIEMKTPEESLGVDSDTYNKIVDECIYGEPKFKVGNWYQCTKDFFGKGVTFDKNTAYYCAKEGCLQNEYGCHIAIVEDLYDNFKLWTIKDARDGDVLVDEDNNIGIYKETEGVYWNSYIYLGCNNHLYGFSIGGSHAQNNTKPATKEQRDLLFSKMKEAGYEWDEEKKESKKIGQKSTWSEDDEEMFDAIIADIKFTQSVHINQVVYEREIDWLKYIRDRIKLA